MKTNTIKIPTETLKKILEGLKTFEEKRLFLHQNITLGRLAKQLKTNTSYLSKVINSYKRKNFKSYLNELRVHYAVQELKHNKELQKYTIDGIAKDMGFNNAESFTIAFRKVTGLYPTFFIKKG
jgi:YesN/AraC family two-component response regulator